jgi:pyruvate,water dikinase
MSYIVSFEQLRMTDVDSVGGKNASLGEMISQLSDAGVRVPGGFATTAQAFRDFLSGTGLDVRIAERLSSLNPEDVRELALAGGQIRQWIVEAPLPDQLHSDIKKAFALLDAGGNGSFAVRSSATAEDLPDASFAGQQETFLNVVGIDDIIDKIRHVFASLYNDRAISYRVHKGYAHADVALSAGIQRMVRSDKGSAGVMFTLDTESGFEDVVFITSSYGLGETVVQGAVNPDEFYVFKPTLASGHYPIVNRRIGSKLIKMEFDPTRAMGLAVRTVDVPVSERNRFSLTDDEVNELARYAVIIEKHYQRPMDIEWGRDGVDGKIYILQARPETVKSQQGHSDIQQRYKLKATGKVIVTGRAIGQKIGSGPVRIVSDLS